jgi:hypothetical protein
MTTDALAILAACDRVLGEIGRRDHMFGWLRVPDADPPQWLSVDAYYPGNRLIALCGGHSEEVSRLCAGRAPTHGLRLLELAPGELDDSEGLDGALERHLAELPPVVRPSGSLPDREGPGVRAASLLPQPATPPVVRHRVGESRAAATARGARFVATHDPPAPAGVIDRQPAGAGLADPKTAPGAAATPPPVRRPTPPPVRRPTPPPVRRPAPARRPAAATAQAPSRPRRTLQVPAVLVGLVVIAVLCLELYYGVARFALGGGHVLLAFGLALDCCARALGTVSARRAGKNDWMWSSALIGSPAVAMFALYAGEGEPPPEPGPLAGMLSLSACAAVVIAMFLAVV